MYLFKRFNFSFVISIIIFVKENIRSNVIVNLIRTFVLTLLSFITFPWVCRYLGDSVLGTYSWAVTFVAYFLILAKIGIPNLAIRECVKVRENKELLSNKAQAFFILQLIATVLSFFLMCVVLFSVPSLREERTSSLIFILSLNFLSGAFSFEWIFIALEKQFYMSIRSIIVLAISAVLIITFVTTESDVYIYAFISISVTILTSIINLYYVRQHISFKKTLPYDFKQYAKPLLVLCSVSLLLSFYNQTDTLILGFINEEKDAVGSYSVGIKGIDIVIGVLTNLSTVFVPRSAYYYGKEDKRFFNNLTKYSFNICLFITLPAIIFMMAMAKPICGLISGSYDFNSYSDSFWVLFILSSMMLTYSLAEMIYGQILLPMKKEKHYLYAILSGVILNIVFSLILGGLVFKNNPAIGVAIGTVITDILIFIYLIGVTWKWVYKALFNKNTLKLIFATIIVLVSSIGIHYLLTQSILPNFNLSSSSNMLIELITIFVIDIVIYIAILLLLKEDLVYSFIRKSPKPI